MNYYLTTALLIGALCLSAGYAEEKGRHPPALGLGKKSIAKVTSDELVKALLGKKVKIDGGEWTFPEKDGRTRVTIKEVEVYGVHHGTGKQTQHMTVLAEVRSSCSCTKHLKGEAAFLYDYVKGEWGLKEINTSKLKER